MDVLLDPFSQPFVQRAWLELALLSVPAGVLGTLVVLRRLAFATHAFGVGAFPGVVVAAGIGFSAFVGGLLASLSLAALLSLLVRRRDLDAPAGIGLLLTASVALGSLLVSDVYASGGDIDTLLLGSLFGVQDGDLARTAVIALVVVLAVAVQGRGWLVLAFDPDSARALGVARGRHDVVLLGVLALVVVASVDAVGALLASSLLVVPAAAARLVAVRALPAMAVAAGVSLLASTGGIVLAFHLDAPPGATVVLTAAGLFGLAAGARRLAEPRRARRTLAVAGAALLVVILAGCSSDATDRSAAEPDGGVQPAADALPIVVTTSVLADWVRIVGGERVRVTQLLQPNVDPHEFEPGADAARAVGEASLIFASGAGLDDWSADLVHSTGSDATFIEVAPDDALRPPALAEGGTVDPHYWHDPALAGRAVDVVAQALAQTDPGHAGLYRGHAEVYRGELEALDAELTRTFDRVPAAERTMVTDHDAFGYLARRYGIQVVGAAIPSASTAADASAGETAALVDAIRDHHVRAVFSEASVDPHLIDDIGSETGATVYDDLYGDALGPPGSGAATYLELMRHNAAVLVKGFTGA